MSFLVLDGLSKRYGKQQALADFNLTVERGEFISLLGPSGCGKTTTLQALAGFVPLSAGRIQLDGRDITHLAPDKRGLGVVFQSYALFPHMTVAANVGFGLEMRGVAATERAERVARMLQRVHLGDYAGRYPRELSGGQRQRVAIARALVIEPQLLLLDEPLSNLDAKLRESLQFELRRLQRQLGTTTLMVTHDQAEALSISDRVVVMEAGRIRQVDVPQRLYEHPKSDFICGFVGKTNLLQGRAEAGAITLDGGLRLPWPGSGATDGTGAQGPGPAPTPTQATGADGRVQLVLRPEKLRLVPAGSGRLPVRVAERFFLGSQWLYRVDSGFGPLEVALTNDGRAPWPEGAEAGLDWPDDALRCLPATSAATSAATASASGA